jgi:hypothetical protein
VTWDAVDADARDLVYVDVLSPRMTMRCTSSEAGHVSIPSSAVIGDDAQIAVHHLHVESFKAKGIEPGEVRFDVAKLVAFHR